MRVAVGRLHFKDAVSDFEHRNVKRAAAEIVHRDFLVLLLVETIGKRGRGRFVDDAEDFETRDLASVLGRVALRVVEISRHRDHGLRDLLAELRFRVGFQLRQDHRGNFGWRKSLFLAVHFHLDMRVTVRRLHKLVRHAVFFLVHLIELSAHETLDREHRVCRIRHRLTLCGLTNQPLTILRESNDRRRSTCAFAIFQNHRVATFHHRHAGVGGSQIDT